MRRCRELRRYLLAMSAAVLLGMLIASPPLAYADNPVVVLDDQHDLLNAAGRLAPSQFYLDFVDIMEGSAVIDFVPLYGDGLYYIFEMTLWSTPSEWFQSAWVPAFTNSPVHIERVRYQWNFVDSAFNTVGAIRVIFRADLSGEIRVNAMVCVPTVQDLPDQSMADCGPESYSTPDALHLAIDPNANALSLAISVGDFHGLFTKAVYWRAQASAFLTSMGVAQIRDNAPRKLLPEE